VWNHLPFDYIFAGVSLSPFYPHISSHILYKYIFCLCGVNWRVRPSVFGVQSLSHNIYIGFHMYDSVSHNYLSYWIFCHIYHTKINFIHGRCLCVSWGWNVVRNLWNMCCIGTPSWKWLEMPRTWVVINSPDQWLAILQNITMYGSQNWSQCFSLTVTSGSLFSV
jgi:hypothetical protein